MTFILRFFHFRIIRDFLNLRASIRVVGHFRGIKIATLRITCERQIDVMYKMKYCLPTYTGIVFVILSPQRDNHSVCNTY